MLRLDLDVFVPVAVDRAARAARGARGGAELDLFMEARLKLKSMVDGSCFVVLCMCVQCMVVSCRLIFRNAKGDQSLGPSFITKMQGRHDTRKPLPMDPPENRDNSAQRDIFFNPCVSIDHVQTVSESESSVCV